MCSQTALGAALFGAGASAVDGLRELHVRMARQELDVNRLAWYLFHPLIGGALGSVLFFVVRAGLLALRADSDGYSPIPVYTLAMLAAFGQRQVIQFLREKLANALRIKGEAPEEAG